MVKDEPLTTVVESCIEQFGSDFSRGSDNHIWYEADARFRLLSYLSSELDPQPECPGVVHAELPAENGQRYDIAVFEKEIAQGIVTEDFTDANWYREIKKKPVGVVIEVALAWIYDDGRFASMYPPSKTRINSAIQRLVNNGKNSQLKPGSTHYVVICCTTKQYDKARNPARKRSVDKGKEWVEKKLNELCENTQITVKVYWVSDHHEDTPHWYEHKASFR